MIFVIFMLSRLFLIFNLLAFSAQAEKPFLHVSFDVTRELFKEINYEFIKEYNVTNKIRQSHGGSGKQTAAVIHGLPADVVSLALPYHMDLLAEKGMVANNWRELFPNNSAPLSTSIVFLVPKNNPKNIKDWDDLIRPNIKVITPNPKTSGGALWNYAAAWIYANKIHSNNLELAKDFMAKLYNNAPVLDSTARGSALTFLKRNLGDVLITWQSEAEFIIAKLDPNYEIIYPSISIKIDIPIATIIKNKKNYQNLANQYIKFLFSSKGQEIIKKNYYYGYKESSNRALIKEDTINWPEFKKQHFSENGIFDQIYK